MQAFGRNQISVPRTGGIFDSVQVSGFSKFQILTPDT